MQTVIRQETPEGVEVYEDVLTIIRPEVFTRHILYETGGAAVFTGFTMTEALREDEQSIVDALRLLNLIPHDDYIVVTELFPGSLAGERYSLVNPETDREEYFLMRC